MLVATELQIFVLLQWVLITLFAVVLLTIIYRIVTGTSRRTDTQIITPPSGQKILTYYTTDIGEAEGMLKHAEELLNVGEERRAVEISYNAVQTVFSQILSRVVQGEPDYSLTDSLRLMNESGFATNLQSAVEGLNNAKLRLALGRALTKEQAAAAINLARLIVASAKEVPFRPRTQA
jgi:HEPN domain-containing protein